jgi:hypothetical protein
MDLHPQSNRPAGVVNGKTSRNHWNYGGLHHMQQPAALSFSYVSSSYSYAAKLGGARSDGVAVVSIRISLPTLHSGQRHGSVA